MEPVASSSPEAQAPEAQSSPASVLQPAAAVPPAEPASLPEDKDLKKQESEALETIQKQAGPEKDCSLALLDLQKQRNLLFHSYLSELREIEIRYSGLYDPLYQQRKAALMQHSQAAGFWLKVLENNMISKGYIFEKDQELLRFLVDVRVVEEPNNEDFRLEFEFAENSYISDTVLTKKFLHDGNGDLRTAEGSEIHWKGENFTEKKIKKKKSKKGKTQTTIKTVINPSFFGFFKTKSAEDDSDHEDGAEEEFLPLASMDEDEDLGSEVRDEIVPNALLYFLGVRRKEEEDEEDIEDSDEDDGEGAKKHDKEKKTVDAAGKGKEECKNQ